MASASRLALFAVLFTLVPPTLAQAAGTWRPPVPGEVLRHFSYGPDPFRTGQHRGVDFAARPDERVRSACAGRVTFAGGTDGGTGPVRSSGASGATGSAVSVRCASWRVSYLPVRDVRIRAGAAVRRGTVLGRVGRDRRHAGLHLGVRREGRRWAYVDPLALLSPEPPPPPSPAPRGPGRTPWLPRTAPGRVRPVPVPVPGARPLAVPGADPVPRPAPVGLPVAGTPPQPLARPVSTAGPLAPWPVWLGLGLGLAGLLGAGASRQGTRRRRARRAALATAPARAE